MLFFLLLLLLQSLTFYTFSENIKLAFFLSVLSLLFELENAEGGREVVRISVLSFSTNIYTCIYTTHRYLSWCYIRRFSFLAPSDDFQAIRIKRCMRLGGSPLQRDNQHNSLKLLDRVSAGFSSPPANDQIYWPSSWPRIYIQLSTIYPRVVILCGGGLLASPEKELYSLYFSVFCSFPLWYILYLSLSF